MSARPAYQRSGPWDAPDNFYFYGGDFSNFAQTPGLALPGGWYGHPRVPALVAVPDVEHYFQACKTTSLEDFLWVMDALTAASAKRRGGPRGEAGRRIELRPDWEEVKFSVGFASLEKFKRQPFHQALLATGGANACGEQPFGLHLGRMRSRRRLHRPQSSRLGLDGGARQVARLPCCGLAD
jgi:predicted NAD-dependent protein-ADP-ribosyltransferase YbiA (DUF1768 family)